jgi:hypothetical protein
LIALYVVLQDSWKSEETAIESNIGKALKMVKEDTSSTH